MSEPETATARRRAARAVAFLNDLRINDVPSTPPTPYTHAAHVLVYCSGAAVTEDPVERAVALLNTEPCWSALSSLMGWRGRPVSITVAPHSVVVVNGATFEINKAGAADVDGVILVGVDFFAAIKHDNR